MPIYMGVTGNCAVANQLGVSYGTVYRTLKTISITQPASFNR